MIHCEKNLLGDDAAIFTLTDLLSPDECAGFIRQTERAGFDSAPVTTSRGFVMMPDLRNNTRVMVDDLEQARWLWARLAPFVPARLGPWRAVGVNERFRYYRYDPGQYFRWHGDGAFIRSEVERSLYTAMVYLNDECDGGTTDFRDGVSVAPRRGMGLVFEHHLVHQGAPVARGRKYVLRTDVMYRRDAGPSAD